MDPICAAFEGFMFVFAWAEYWSRLWIVPEIALARELSLRRGPLGTSAARLFRCVYLKLESQELFGVYSRPHNTAVMSNFLRLLRSPDGHGQSKFMCFSLLRRKLDEVTSGCGPQLYHITDALATYSAQRCTIARDRIYGLLSLTTSICKPDYAAPSIIVYLQILVENLLVQPFNADYADWEGVEDQVRRGGLIFYTLAALQLSLENTDVLFFTYLAATECGLHDTLIWNILYAACLHKHNKPRLTMLLSYARKRSVAKFVRLIIGHLHRMPAHWQNKISEYNTIVCEIVEDVRMRLRQREETNTDAPVARFSTVEGATPRHTPPD